MVHGFLGNLAVWHLKIIPALYNEFRITTYDLRGHGFSDVTADGYSSGSLAEDLRGLLDNLDIPQVALVGHSFGADVCLHFALRYPERVSKMVVIEPGLAAAMQQRKGAEWKGWAYWVSKLEQAGLQVPDDKRTDLRFLLDLSLQTPRFYGPLKGLPRNREPLLHLLHATNLINDSLEVGDLTLEALRCIRTKTLLIYGDQSPFLDSYEMLRDALPNRTAVLMADGDHFPLLERPEPLRERILDFLRESNLELGQEESLRGASVGAAGQQDF